MTEFLRYISRKENKIFLYSALTIGIGYFIMLRFLYPVPAFYFDSYTYIQVARDHSPISFRPIEYAQLLNLFKAISTSDVALIAAQYFSNLIANLFLFFTFTWFFTFHRTCKVIFFILVICNPLYLFYSNYILTDAFFSAFTVIWFTVLVWLIYKPGWLLNIFQLIVLAFLFRLRYNAIIFPVFTAIAFILSNQATWKKLLGFVPSLVLILALVLVTIKTNEYYTGTRTFSAFSGWQLANNALHILRSEDIDITNIPDRQTKEIIEVSKRYFNNAKIPFNHARPTADYMWNASSPLKTYMATFAIKHSRKSYLQTWTALGPVYNNFGKTIIFKKPLSYLKYFVLPNAIQYFIPELEAYKSYFNKNETINEVAIKFYHYKSNKPGRQHQFVYDFVFKSWPYIFPAINVLFLVLTFLYLFSKKRLKRSPLFNRVLVCFSAFYFANFFFIVLLAPTVFRYHIFIITLLFPVLLLLLQELVTWKRNDEAKVNSNMVE
jgi:hypothetical protein